MTKDDFIDSYCKRSNISRELFHRFKVALPCQCGDEACLGWAAISHDYGAITSHIKFYGPNPDEWQDNQ